MDHNNRLVVCQTVLNIRWRMMAAQQERDWTAARLWQEKELAHVKSACPKCNPTWFASDLWPGQAVEVGKVTG